MRNIHLLKIDPEYFEDIVKGYKTCEIRKNDRDYHIGDILILAEWQYEEYTGSLYATTITHIDDYPDALKDGYVVLSFNTKKGIEFYL